MSLEFHRKKGLAQIIVINPGDRNIEYLKDLGEQFRVENADKKFAFIYIFDNKEAAEMCGDESDWTKEQEDFYLSHFIASYIKNTHSRFHRYLIHLTHDSDGELEIKYLLN